MKRIVLSAILVSGIITVSPYLAEAFTTPAAGSFAYDMYDIAVNRILEGPIGFVGGVGAIVFGAIAAIRAQIMAAIPAILGGAAMLKAADIVESMGMLI